VNDEMIKLGDIVQDRISGFKGTVIAKVEYLNGCIQFCVKPKTGKDGKMIEGEYIDMEQLEVVGQLFPNKAKKNGGPKSDMPPTNYRG
jgi:hypothetical protein